MSVKSRADQFAGGGVTGTDEFFQSESLEILCKIFGEVAPLRVIAWEQNSFTPKGVNVKIQVSGYFLFYSVVLCIELVILGFFSFA